MAPEPSLLGEVNCEGRSHESIRQIAWHAMPFHFILSFFL